MSQKARGVFTVLVHVQRGTGIEVVQMDDIPDGREAMRIINEAAHAARVTIQQNANTMRYQGQVSPADTAVGSPQVNPTDAADPYAQLRPLGELRDSGILTEEEFAAKKAEILSRL